jgi:SNW domain-containing protein 1
MKIERNNLRNIRKKEIENQRKMEVSGKRNKINPRDEDRDISEKIALGQAQPSGRDSMIDARLYNQTTGLESGFKDEEDYDLYDKPLFADRTAASIYKNIKANSSIDDDSTTSAIDSKKLMEKIHQRGKMFEGADISKAEGGRPVEFEKNNEEYGLNDIHNKKFKN